MTGVKLCRETSAGDQAAALARGDHVGDGGVIGRVKISSARRLRSAGGEAAIAGHRRCRRSPGRSRWDSPSAGCSRSPAANSRRAAPAHPDAATAAASPRRCRCPRRYAGPARPGVRPRVPRDRGKARPAWSAIRTTRPAPSLLMISNGGGSSGCNRRPASGWGMAAVWDTGAFWNWRAKGLNRRPLDQIAPRPSTLGPATGPPRRRRPGPR